ncbi:FkbM family methyltransferase [Pseudaestuariivita sp.]|uniref:FkbM family methyltransferase n=1 Tax=Pseudaestuariivita sp. TaxID=2211669 RepID=UPI00405A4761
MALRRSLALAVRRTQDRLKRPSGIITRNYMDVFRDLPPAEAVAEVNRTLHARGRTQQRYVYEPDTGLYRCEDAGRTHVFSEMTWLRTLSAGLEERAAKLWNAYLLQHIPFAAGDHVVEVGANVGDVALTLQVKGCKVNLTCFEPAPREFAALSRNLAAASDLAAARAHQMALWHSDSEGMTFYLKSGTADSSLLPMEAYDDTVTVPSARLDSVLERRPYRLLKLEAEGAEPEILEGADGVLDCFQYITADVGFERGMRQESTLPEVANHLIARGWQARVFGKGRHVLLFENPGWTP